MGNVSFLARIYYGLLAAALLPILVIGAAALGWSERVLIDRATFHLHSVVQLQHDRLQTLVERHLERFSLVASHTQLRLSLDRFLSTQDPVHKARITRIIGDTLAAVPDLERIAVLDPDGNVVVSTDSTLVSTTRQPPRGAGLPTAVTPRLEIYRSVGGAIRSRVMGPMFLDGRSVGALLVDMSGADIVGVVMNVTGLGESGETLLVKRTENGDALMLTPTRFDANAGLRRLIAGTRNDMPAIRALKGISDAQSDGVDYRGIAVIAATSIIPELGWGVVAKMDRAEVLSSIRNAQGAALAALLIACVVVAFVVAGISRAFRKPVRALLDAASQIALGNLSIRVPLSGRGEFTELAQAFNNMCRSLESSRDQVDLEIERRGQLEERFRRIIESAPTAMVLCDSRGRIALVNKVTERLFGYGREELMGESIEMLIPERYRATHPRHRENYCDAPTSRAMGAGRELAGLRKDGSEVPIEIGLNPIETDTGTMVLSAVIDLTERRLFESDLMDKNQRLEQEFWLKTGQTELANAMRGVSGVDEVVKKALNFLCAYLDACVGTCYVSDPEGTLHFRAGYGMPEQGVPRTLRAGRGLLGQAVRDQKLSLYTNPPGNHLTIDSSFGTVSPAGLAVVPLVYHDRVLGALELASMTGFTGQHEELLSLASESIAIAVDVSLTAERMEELLDESQRKSRALEQASEYKSSFLANMSHELRTPLNSLLILAQSLASNPEGRLSDDERKAAEIIESNGRNLLDLINDILDMSKIEAGKLQVHSEPVDIRMAVTEIAERFTPIASQAGHQFQALVDENVPPTIETDHQRLIQILTNLLSNASKFTNEGSITLTVRQAACSDVDGNTCVLFEVSDSGIGIDLAKQHEIFGAFVQADASRTRAHGGTGLGLSISRQLAELLGGEITLHSVPGEGSTFTLVLAEKAADSVPEKATVSPVGESGRVPDSENLAKLASAAPEVRERVVLLDRDMRRAFSLVSRLARDGVAAHIAPSASRVITLIDEMEGCDAIVLCGVSSLSACAADIQNLRTSSLRAARIPMLVAPAGPMANGDGESGEWAPDHVFDGDITANALRLALARAATVRSSAA